ncbi:formate/nitrite transporter family protein [Syntrophomonas wolfei]|jgi:formate/nitrite transporter|nr:formate/nitrite transporter family protein [Syntrophomonas wolfei]
MFEDYNNKGRVNKLMNFLTPAEIAVATANAGKAKCELPIIKMFVLGILAGVYIGFGANLATKIGSMAASDTSGGQFLFGAVFSVGLMLVVIAGSELFTGNCMFCCISSLNGQSTWGGLLKNWVIVFLANFVGSVLLVYIIFYGGFWGDGAVATAISAHGIKALGIAKAKMSLTWGQAFCRAIGCNWLVCLAVWVALASKDIIGKIFGIFFPIMAFVSSGFEHSVANMFFIPMGITIAQNNPELVAAATKIGADGTAVSVFNMTAEQVTAFFTYGNFINANLIPVTLGNIVGGSIFVAMFYWFIYLKK